MRSASRSVTLITDSQFRRDRAYILDSPIQRESPLRALPRGRIVAREVQVRSQPPSERITRREFVAAGTLASAALAAGCSSRRGEWEFLSEEQAAILAAVCDQIIPADDYPAASQAGVVRYIDHQLTGPYRRHQKIYTVGLRQMEDLCRSRFGVSLADAQAGQKLEVVRILEEQHNPIFTLVRSHTMEGYYGSPRHGGNRNAVSWNMLGLTEPPVRGRAQYDLTAGRRP